MLGVGALAFAGAGTKREPVAAQAIAVVTRAKCLKCKFSSGRKSTDRGLSPARRIVAKDALDSWQPQGDEFSRIRQSGLACRNRHRHSAAKLMAPLHSKASAKVNLTLRVVRKRADGYHDIVSLVAFAETGDQLTLTPGPKLELDLSGPNAAAMGEAADNLVLLAAHALAEHVANLVVGRFELTKRLPVGAGLGGGSSDAAAALRLLAHANGLELDDPRIFAAARKTGADVPVCIEEKARVISGIGDRLSEPLQLPALPCVILFPEVSIATRLAFARYDELGMESLSGRFNDHPEAGLIPVGRAKFFAFLHSQTNDLERAAFTLTPAVEIAQERLQLTTGVKLARMSGSGPSVIALYDTAEQAEKAANEIGAEHPEWWVSATTLR
jgi:4-diphosphocytidyl-2-C-methyl-D-erythritol kinase